MKIFEMYNTYNYELSYIKAYNKEHAYQLLRSGLYDSAQRKSQLSAFMDELLFTELIELSTKEYESITDNYYCSGYESIESDLVSDFDYRYSYRDEVIATHDPVAK